MALTRRAALKTVGGTFALLGASGVATANGPPEGAGNGPPEGTGNGPPGEARNNSCACPDGTVLLAKYEVEDGELVYEKDGDFLNVGDDYTFEVTDTKDDGEILGFEVETDDTTDDIYPFDGLTVKTGEGCYQKTALLSDENMSLEGGQSETFDARNFDEDDPVQAVSNVQICTRPSWQADFGTGPVPEPPAYGQSADSELIMAEFGTGRTDPDASDPDKDERPGDFGVDVSDGFDVEDGTISVEFAVAEDDTDLHLAVFNKPGPGNEIELPPENQELHDKQRKTYTEGEGDTLTVDLPSVDDY